MERLFSLYTRVHDILESQGRRKELRGLRELSQELNLDASTEELLSAERAFTYADLYAMLGNANTIAWLTPHAVVTREGGSGEGESVSHSSWLQQDDSCRFLFDVDGNTIFALARSPEHLSEISDVVLRLLAVSLVHSVNLRNKWTSRDNASINSPTLAYLMEQCQSLKVLKLQYLKSLDENHCRALGTFSRPGLEIELISCGFTGAGETALVEVLGRNQGPTKLINCDVDNIALADVLRGYSRLKSVSQDFYEDFDVGNRQVLAIANALRENKGLVELSLFYGFHANDETWGAVCDSLKTHPTLEVFNLFASGEPAPRALDVTTFRIQALVDMMKVNTSIYTIHVSICYSETEMYRESVIPYLETNRSRPRVRAIQKARPIMYRAKVLGRALLAARTDTNSFWMLLAGNAEVAFPSRRTTIAAANIPTSATATSTVNVTAVAASVMSTLTTTTTVSLHAATASDGFASTPHVAAATDANVATPSAGQKRKASP
jgi:hypothetical protein